MASALPAKPGGDGSRGSQSPADHMNIELKSVPSPCTGICKVDEVLGWCLGCGRTEEEIAEWPSAGDARRAGIWDLLPARIKALGIALTRLPWRRDRIAEFAARSLSEKTGTWAVGCDGAGAQFLCANDEPCEISVSEEEVCALSERGRLKLTIDENVRALQVHNGRPEGGAILLAVLKAKTSLPVATGLTPLGPDAGALKSECRNEPWFDLGLGRADLRLCLRTAEPKLQDILTRSAGLALPELLHIAGPAILDYNPTRVFVSPLGRVEVFALAPPLGGAAQTSRVTPAQFACVSAAAPRIDLPPVYALGATFHPRARGKDGG
jgi:predicted Fe-S protein YdhL (DUF1289 family)